MKLRYFTSWQGFLDSFKIGDRYVWSIIWFRLQAAFGTIAGIWVQIDPQVFSAIDPKYVVLFIVINAFLSEWLRWRKANTDSEGA